MRGWPDPGPPPYPDRAPVALAPPPVGRPHLPSCLLAQRRLLPSPEPVFDPFSPPTCALSRWNIVGRKEVPGRVGRDPGQLPGLTRFTLRPCRGRRVLANQPKSNVRITRWY